MAEAELANRRLQPLGHLSAGKMLMAQTGLKSMLGRATVRSGAAALTIAGAAWRSYKPARRRAPVPIEVRAPWYDTKRRDFALSGSVRPWPTRSE
jgi:hypothetical protein